MTDIYTPPDTLVTAFVDRDVYKSAIAFVDLQRIYPGLQRDTPMMTIEEPSYVLICFKPLSEASAEEREALGMR